MSYILDALKKAESERGLSAAPKPPELRSIALLPARQPWLVSAPLVLALLTLTLFLLALLYWYKSSPKEATYTVTVTTARPDPAVHSPLSTPAIMSSIPAPPIPSASPVVKPLPAQALAMASMGMAQKEHEQIPELRELPEALQRDIPVLTVSGYIYADLPADRSIIINRKFLREGDQVASDLLLEKLTPGGMVLNFRGTRYRATY
jgi:general secretion pathway protein B